MTISDPNVGSVSAPDTVSFEYSSERGRWCAHVGAASLWSPTLPAARRAIRALYPTVDREIVSIDERCDELLALMHAADGEDRRAMGKRVVARLLAKEVVIDIDDLADVLSMPRTDVAELVVDVASDHLVSRARRNLL